MINNLEIFRNDFLNANSWPQRKDGVPLDLLDNLSKEERVVAEKELIEALSINDTWPIIGVGYLKSKESLPKLYELLRKSEKNIKITVAFSIYQISNDLEMIDISIKEAKKIKDQHQIIDILFKLRGFKDERTDNLLKEFTEHSKYLVAYNATRALGLSTDSVVEKFRNK